MNINRVLCFCFVSALCGGNSVSAKLNIYAGAEGGNGSISCYMSLSGSTKFFCKDECKAEDILIKTDEVRAQSGRYSTTYRNNSSGRVSLSVTITHLIKSDSGRYRSGLGKNLVPDSYCDFEVRVLDASLLEDHSVFIHADTEGENITFGCANTVYGEQKFLCKGDCKTEEDIIIETDKNRAQNDRYSIKYIEGSVFGLHVTITEATTSDTGRYRCGYGRALSPDSYNTYKILVLSVPVTTKPNWTLQPLSTSAPSAPTEPTTQSLTSSSGSFTSSSAFPETTHQSAAEGTVHGVQTAPTTSRPNLTLRPFSTSVPSASSQTTTPSLTSSSGGSACSHVPGYFLPLAVILSLVGVLVSVLLLLNILKTRRHFTLINGNVELPVVYKNLSPDFTNESRKD